MNDLLDGFSRLDEEEQSLTQGFDVLPEVPQGEDLTGGSNVERTVESPSTENGLLEGFSRTSDPNQETVRSNVERTVDQPGTDEEGFEFFDPFVKTPVALGFGMASWPFAQAARFGAVGGQKAQQALGLVSEMSDEEITDLGNQTAEWFSTLGGVLDPKSDIGKTAVRYAGEFVKPITMAAQWINSGIDKEKYPHLSDLAEVSTEAMMFGFLHKFGKESIDVGKRQLKVRRKKGQAKIREQRKLEQKQAEVLAKVEKAAKEGKLEKTIADYQEAIIPIVKEQAAGQAPTGQKIRTVAERAQAERLGRQEASPEQQPGRVAREAERFQEGLVPDRRSLSEQSQRQGGEGEVRRPDLGREPQTGLDPLTQEPVAPKPEVTMLTEEGIPRATYQVENGKIKEVESIGAKETSQINPETGKVELVEKIPGQRSVYQILLDPLKNESGAVDISALRDTFGKAPKAGSLLNRMLKEGISKDDLILSGLGGYLKEKGQNKIDWKEFKKVADEGGFDVQKKTGREVPLDESLPEGARESDFQFEPKYMNESYNLPGKLAESYKENLYKFDPKKAELKKEMDKVSSLEGDEWLSAVDKIDKRVESQPSFDESHWQEEGQNVMAHSRQHDRLVGENKDVAYVDEIQSKWHDRGRNDGYEVKKGSPRFTGDDIGVSGVPNAPFKKTWPQMIMRDVITDAVSRGKEGVAWSTGNIQQKRWPGAKTDYASLYDKKIKKFMEKESGVKAEKVETSTDAKYDLIQEEFKDLDRRKANTTNKEVLEDIAAERSVLEDQLKRNSEKVWYVPLTSKLKKLYSDTSASRDAIDMLLSPLRNESGAITIPKSRKKLLEGTTETFRENVRKFGKLAEEAGIPFKEFLKNNDFSKQEIRQMLKVSEAVKMDRPMASAKEMPRVGSKDFKIKELEKGDTQINVGKDSNQNIKFGLKDFEKFAQVPKLKSGGLVQGLTVPENFFSTHKSLKPLLNMKRARDKALGKDTKRLTDVFKDIEKSYPNKKLRKEAGALQISKGKFGEKALQKMGVKVNPDAKYQGLNAELQPILQDGLKRMNEVRKMNGRKPIKEMEDFIAWFAEENFWKDVKELVGGDFNRQGPSLVHDSLETIKSRHSQTALDMGNFNHVTREGLRDGVKLERDPLVIAQRYMNEVLPVIHYAELNSFIKEGMTKDLTLPNGKKVNFSDKHKGINQGLAQELISWSNSLVGKSNSPLPHLVEKQLGRLRRNLTNATLVGNLRTTAIQLTALQPSFVERPGRTVQGALDFMADLGRKKPKFDREKYNSLPDKSSGLSTIDTSFSDATSAIGGTKLQKTGVATKNMLSWAMKQLDYVSREIAARAKESELKKAVKEGRLSEKEMIEQVDSAVVRTQSSGARGEVSPIQRSELGKIMTLWQTFTIGHINWLAKEVLGIKNPEATPARTANRVFRYVATTAILGAVFEDVIGIQSPGPAPGQAIKRALESGETDLFKLALTTGRELSELLPFGGSIKFGSSVFGPVVDFLNDVTGLAAGTDIYNKDTLAKARKGDVKSIIKILEVAGKLKGVPGTAQVAKTARGLLRDETLIRAMIGRIPEQSSGSAGKKRSRRKRKTRKRRTR